MLYDVDIEVTKKKKKDKDKKGEEEVEEFDEEMEDYANLPEEIENKDLLGRVWITLERR